MNLVLIGARGTGKSTVAGMLAAKLGMESVSLDHEIERAAGRSIAEVVAEHGWERFRDLEAAAVKRTAARDNVIIDAGGGVVVRSDNVSLLRRRGVLFWLRASVPAIVKRIAAGTYRPPLTEGKSFTEEVEAVLHERTPLYKHAADYAVETDDRDPDGVAAEIARLFEAHRNRRRGGQS